MNKNKALTIFSSVVIFLLLVLVPAYISAEEVYDPNFGYSFDLPEGYYIDAHSEDGLNYVFAHKNFPVNAALRLYGTDQYKDSEQTLKAVMQKLGGSGDYSSFIWQNTNCSFCIFDTTIPGDNYESSVWILAVELKSVKANLVLLAYSQKKYIDSARPFFFSILNSLTLDRENKNTPGPLISFTYPQQNKQDITVKISGKSIDSVIYEEDYEANLFVIETEMNILALYAQMANWKEAWQRYYRMIYRDSAFRLKRFTNDVYRVLYPLAKKKNPDNMPYEINAMLLDWVQYMPYGRNTTANSADLTPSPNVITGSVSDCDSRSLLVCIMLNQIGVDSTMFVSQEYKHAIYGTRIKEASASENARIEVNGKWYLLNETTAKGVKPGLIDASQNDTEKWIPVRFD